MTVLLRIIKQLAFSQAVHWLPFNKKTFLLYLLPFMTRVIYCLFTELFRVFCKRLRVRCIQSCCCCFFDGSIKSYHHLLRLNQIFTMEFLLVLWWKLASFLWNPHRIIIDSQTFLVFLELKFEAKVGTYFRSYSSYEFYCIGESRPKLLHIVGYD